MKVAASIWVLPPQLGHEVGLPRPTQSPVSILQLYTRTVGDKNTVTLSHITLGCPGVVVIQKEGMACLQGTPKNLLPGHNRKLRPRQGCEQGRSRENLIFHT